MHRNYEKCMNRSPQEDCRNEVKLDTLMTKLNRIKMENDILNRILTEIQYYKPEINSKPRTMQER